MTAWHLPTRTPSPARGRRLTSQWDPREERESRKPSFARGQLGHTVELLLPIKGRVALDLTQLSLARRPCGTPAARDLSHRVGQIFHSLNFQSGRAKEPLVFTWRLEAKLV